MKRTTLSCLLIAAASMTAWPAAARAERIKDICNVNGVRSNPLVGYGLVMGLSGTGDDSSLTRRAIANVMRTKNFDIVLKPEDFASKTLASVMVTTQLPPFARRDSSMDVTVSAIAGAASLQGGTLLMTQLKGADGEVYAIAQGPLVLGGFQAAGRAARVTKNVVTVGRIPNGAHVEKEERAEFVQDGEIILDLRHADSTTAENIAAAINGKAGEIAYAPDAGSVRIKVPATVTKRTVNGFLKDLLALEVEVDNAAAIVVNERTGTVVVGKNVRITEVAISHANLHVVVEERKQVSQASPFAQGGSTKSVDRTVAKTIEGRSPLIPIQKQANVSELAEKLNALGVTPRDLISIFQALKEEGALQAELRVVR